MESTERPQLALFCDHLLESGRAESTDQLILEFGEEQLEAGRAWFASRLGHLVDGGESCADGMSLTGYERRLACLPICIDTACLVRP
jgi:hypothetical protein